MVAGVLTRNLHPFPRKILNIPLPSYWMPYHPIKWMSMKEVNSTREGMLCRWNSHSHCFTKKLSFTLNSILACIWILSCMKPRNHHGWQTLGSPDPRNACIKGFSRGNRAWYEFWWRVELTQLQGRNLFTGEGVSGRENSLCQGWSH